MAAARGPTGARVLAGSAYDRGARALLRTFGGPLAAPSANPSGAVSPTRADHVRQSLGDKVDVILDGGPCRVGLESTIVKIDGERVQLLRPGGVTQEAIEAMLGIAVEPPPIAAKPMAPGMLESHYAPAARLRLNSMAPEPDEAFLAFGPAPDHAHTLNLSKDGDLTEAAANLFAHLRALDALCADRGLAGIAAAPIPETGLGVAINDRLRRAAISAGGKSMAPA